MLSGYATMCRQVRALVFVWARVWATGQPDALACIHPVSERARDLLMLAGEWSKAAELVVTAEERADLDYLRERAEQKQKAKSASG